MALLLADSGSTKTDWCFIADDLQTTYFETKGLNPNFNTEEEFAKQLTLIPAEISEQHLAGIYFYGSGCSFEKDFNFVKQQLSKYLKATKIEVSNDVLCAAIASCGLNDGYAAILGTGMNLCYYANEEITHTIFSLGYVLGDEGGGVYKGKLLVTAYLRNELPADLKLAFETMYNTTKNDIIHSIYKLPQGNRFLAQFTRFLKEYEDHPFVSALLRQSFEAFFEHYVLKLPVLGAAKRINYVGSIAQVFQKTLLQVSTHYGYELGDIQLKPIEGLANFYIRKLNLAASKI